MTSLNIDSFAGGGASEGIRAALGRDSVCPQMAEALVAANYREEADRRPTRIAAPVPLFAAE